MGVWKNADGLKVKFDDEIANPTVNVPGQVVEGTVVKTLKVDFTFDKLPGPDDTGSGYSGEVAYIPAGSFITNAYLIATADWGGTTPTLTLGLEQQDGTTIDADGIDAAIAEAALDVGDVVYCDGALIGGNVVSTTANAYVVATTGGTVTSGSAVLFVEYIDAGFTDDTVE